MKKMLRNWIEKWDKVVMALLSLLALIPVCLLWNSIAPVICGFGRITFMEGCVFGWIRILLFWTYNKIYPEAKILSQKY